MSRRHTRIAWGVMLGLCVCICVGLSIGQAQSDKTPVVETLLPAVPQARTAARRTQSSNNLKQLGLAMHNFHSAFGHFPQGTHPNEKLKPDKRLSWLVSLLPFVEQGPLYDIIDLEKAWDHKANTKWIKVQVPLFQNPQVSEKKKPAYPTTHYVGIAGIGKDAALLPNRHKNAGVFGYNRVTRIRDITDGTSFTVMITEASKNYGPWGAGGTAGTIRGFIKKPYINGPDGIGGPFPGGCHFLMCDGSVRFVSEKIDPAVVENLARKADGNVIRGF